MRRLALTLVALIGCKDKQPDPPLAGAGSGSGSAVQALPHDGVTVIQAGTPPLQALRYHLTKGDRTASELVWDFDARTDGKSDPQPALVIDLETTVEDVRADGTAVLQLRVAKTQLRGRPGIAPSELVRKEAAAMQDVTIHELLAPDGALSDVRVDAAALPDAARARIDSLSRSLAQAAMRLPAEPVGASASWRERRTLPDGGIRAVSETTYTLTAITGATVAYTAAATSSGEPQAFEQDGLKVQVTNTHGHAETTGSVDLAHYAPELSSSSSFTTAMTVDAPKDTPGAGSSTIEITMAIQVTPLAAAALAAPSGAGAGSDARVAEPAPSSAAGAKAAAPARSGDRRGDRSDQDAHKP